MPKRQVEDHGNGFMVIGTLKVRKALRILEDYVNDVSDYIWATPCFYAGRGSVWLGAGPAEHWDGARDHCGSPIR